MPLTPEEKKQKVLAAGLNPDEYTYVEDNTNDPSSVFNPVDKTPVPAPVTGGSAFLSSLKRSILPSAATLAGMRAGAMLPTVPHPIFGPIVKGAEILGGGLAASMGTGYGQEKVLQAVESPEDYNSGVANYEQGRKEHPVLSAAGDLLPMAPFLGSGGVVGELGKVFQPSTISKAKLLQAAAGSALAGGVEGGREYLQGEDISLPRIAAYGVGGGLLQNTPTKLGERVLGPSFRPPVLPEPEVISSQNKKVPYGYLPERTGPIITPPPEEALKEPVGRDYDKFKQQLEESGPNASTELSKSAAPLDRQIPLKTGGPVIAEPSPLKNYTLNDLLNNSEVADLYKSGKTITVEDLSRILKIEPNKARNLMREWNTPENADLKPFNIEESAKVRSIDEGTKYPGEVKQAASTSDIIPDPTEKFYQEGEDQGVKRSVPAPGINSDPILGFRDEGDFRKLMDQKDIQKGRMFVKEEPQYNPQTGKRILQETEGNTPANLTPSQLTKANELAQKRGVTLQQEPGIISEVTGKEARGYAIPDERRAVVNPYTATSDTGAHEVGHNYLRDLRDSTNPADREFYQKGIKAAGGEEALTEAMGRRVSEIESKPLRTWFEDSANYLGSKVGLAEENTSNALARRLRDDRPFNESPEFQKAVGEVNRYYSEVAPIGSNNQEKQQTPQTRAITTGPLKSVIDSIAEHSPIAAKAVENTERETTRLNGKITNSFIDAASKIKDKTNAVKYIWESRYNEGKPSTVPLNPRDKALIDGPINETYRQVHEEQRANGPLINGREAISNPNLKGPNIISQSVLDTILHKASSVDRKKLINDFIEHQIKHGEASDVAEAKGNFNELLRGFSASGDKNKTAAFNALRKAEGFGIPFSWMEKDPVKLFQRYGNRVARDLAYYRNIESNPEVSALFGHTSSGATGVEPVTGQAIQTAQRRLTGQHTTSETLYSSIEHFVRSLILGPATGVRNTVQTLSQILPYVPARDLPKVGEALTRIKQGFADSMKMGVNRHSITGLETGDVTGLGRVAENLRSMGDIIRKYSGANAIEQWTRAHNMALGEILTESNWGRAAKGDIEARKFLRMFAPEGEELDFRKLGELPESVKLETAARFVERVQGTYGLRGLPSFLLEPSSPAYWFMSLSKWSVEKANVITKDVINPALGGDVGPLIRYTLGGLLTGEAVREITKVLNNKKSSTPDITEIQDKGKMSDWIYKGFELSNLGGLGGLYSDLAKMSGDLVKGYNSKGYTIPSYELAKDLTTEIGNASQAIAEGQHPVDVVQHLALNIITDNIQAVRMVSNNLNQEDMDRADKFRDKRIYDKLDGKNIPPPQGRTDRYASMEEREFKRAKTPEEGKQILEDKIKPKLATESKEDRKKDVARLRENSYQTVPSDRKEADAYYAYIRRTQGVDAMMRLKEDKTKQDKVNRAKERMVR